MLVPIPFPLSSSPGASFPESAGRLINCFAEPLGKVIHAKKQFAPPDVVWRKSPGLSRFAASNHTGYRGSLKVDNTLYAAWSGRASTFSTGGNETSLTGNLDGDEKVFWARNNQTPPNVVCVAPGTGGFIVTTSAVSNWSAADAPNCVCFLDGYFILSYGDGTLRASNLNSTVINSLNYTTAQSKTGGINRVVPFNGQLIALGPNFGEVYTNTGNPTGFPLSKSYTLQRGILSPYALAGHEEGFASMLAWVADDASVVRHNGTPNPQKISPPDLDRLIANVADPTTLEAGVYISGDHAKWVLSCDTFTWEFDIATEKWNERRSYLDQRWRGIGGTKFAGKWLVGDTKAGQLLYVDDKAFDEVGEPLVFQIESGTVQNFPNRTRVARADFNFVTGVGNAEGEDPIATQPKVGIQWTDDGGRNWSNEYLRDLGIQATPSRITMLRTGMAGVYGRRYRLTVSDPIYVAFLGATQDTELRNH